MRIKSCKTNHIVNPMGYQMNHISVTWKVADAKSKKQVAARVLVSDTKDMAHVIYDTGKDKTLSNLGVEISINIKPRTIYYWQVCIWGENEEAVSDVNWFETGKCEEDWKANWITPVWEDVSVHPFMRKSFDLTKRIKSARAYVCGLGVYNLYINGQKAGNEHLAPGCTTYDEWVQCQTYDITEAVKTGRNSIGVMLGNGWAKGRFGTFGDANTPYVNRFYLLGEIQIQYEDGTTEIIGTDRSWKCHESPVIADSIYDGEVYDARKEPDGWTEASWDTTVECDPPGIKCLEDRLSLPVVVKEQRKPIKIIHTPAGEIVLDMGQNMAGWLRCRVDEPRGIKLTLSYGEILQNDNFYNDNLRTAKAEYTYISNGRPAEIEPHFTYYGFRYIKLEGFTRKIRLEDFTGCVVYSDLEDTGTIETTDPFVNRLFLNAKWGQKSNFLDVPTDCPQRDERMGWTADTQVFARTASFNMDTYAFYSKFLHDLWMDQRCKNGMVGNVIPGFTAEKLEQVMPYHGGSAVWGDCATILPWEIYQQYGDSAILKQQYGSMRAWVEWIHDRDIAAGNKGLWRGDYQWGDWLALDGEIEDGTAGGTDEDFIASAYYKHSADIVSKTAGILGKKEDEKKYRTVSDKVKQAIADEYFSKNGRSTINTQTAYLLALQFDLVSEESKERVITDLVTLLKQSNMHLKTGFVGTPFICRVLSDYGYSELAYKVFMQEDYPSWLYAVKMGATTTWERWNSVLPDGSISDNGMNSLNHYAYGSIIEWMYSHMCGIKQLEKYPGYKKFEIRPELNSHISGAKAAFDSPMGQIESGWKRESDGSICIKVTIPFNTEAEVYLPYAEADKISTTSFGHYKFIQNDENVKIHLDAGNHCFMYRLTKDFRNTYTLEYTLKELSENPKTRAALKDCMPTFDMIPAEFKEKKESFFEILDTIFRMASGDAVDDLIAEFNCKLKEIEIPIRQVDFKLDHE